MTPLPLDRQGILHVIKLPIEGSSLPLAYFCYLRPQQITADVYNDSIDDKIFEAIRRVSPTATRTSSHAISKEQVEIAIAQFHNWYPFATKLVYRTSISEDLPQNETFEPQTLVIKTLKQQELNLFTLKNVEEISEKLTNNHSSSDIVKLTHALSPYMGILDRHYKIELSDEEFQCLAASPIIDYKNLWTELKNSPCM